MLARVRRRAGVAALEVVLTTGLCVPAAAVVYFIYEKAVNHFAFRLGNSVGCPLL